MGVMISPEKNVELVSWSFEGTKPLAGSKWNGRETYFIYYAYGRTPVPLEFDMDFKVILFFHELCTKLIYDTALVFRADIFFAFAP